jgi:hypothetical protein
MGVLQPEASGLERRKERLNLPPLPVEIQHRAGIDLSPRQN